MRVFISWSQGRSHQLAEALRWWLPRVIQAVEPWLSSSDISKGDRGAHRLTEQLEATDFGILCVTRESQNRPWLLFEAGALSKKGEARVVPYLLGMEPGELVEPLKQFQYALVDHDGTFETVRTINAVLPLPLGDKELIDTFEVWWPKLEEKIKAIPESPEPPKAPPTGDELTQKMLQEFAGLKEIVTTMAGGKLTIRREDAEKRVIYLENARELASRCRLLLNALVTGVSSAGGLIPATVPTLVSTAVELKQVMASLGLPRSDAEQKIFTDASMNLQRASNFLAEMGRVSSSSSLTSTTSPSSGNL